MAPVICYGIRVMMLCCVLLHSAPPRCCVRRFHRPQPPHPHKPSLVCWPGWLAGWNNRTTRHGTTRHDMTFSGYFSGRYFALGPGGYIAELEPEAELELETAGAGAGSILSACVTECKVTWLTAVGLVGGEGRGWYMRCAVLLCFFRSCPVQRRGPCVVGCGNV